MDDLTLALWHSKCERDYKERHYWENVGIIGNNYDLKMVWRCTQCKKCLIESQELIEIEDDEFRLTKEQEKARKIVNYFLNNVKNPPQLSRKRFSTILNQVYYLAQKEIAEKEKSNERN